MFICIYLYTYIYIYLYLNTYVCLYVYIHILCPLSNPWHISSIIAKPRKWTNEKVLSWFCLDKSVCIKPCIAILPGPYKQHVLYTIRFPAIQTRIFAMSLFVIATRVKILCLGPIGHGKHPTMALKSLPDTIDKAPSEVTRQWVREDIHLEKQLGKALATAGMHSQQGYNRQGTKRSHKAIGNMQ